MKNARNLNEYMNAFDDGGGPVGDGSEGAKFQHDLNIARLWQAEADSFEHKYLAALALLREARGIIIKDLPQRSQKRIRRVADLVIRIDAKLGEGAGDGE